MDSQVETIEVNVILQGLDHKHHRHLNTLCIPDVRSGESVYNLRQLLLDIPEVCHISKSCHLEVISGAELQSVQSQRQGNNKNKKKGHKKKLHLPKGKVLDDFVVLETYLDVLKNGYVCVVPDAYTFQSGWDHVTHLNDILMNPPGPLLNTSQSKNGKKEQVTPSSEQEEVNEDEEQERKQFESELKNHVLGEDLPFSQINLLNYDKIDEVEAVRQKRVEKCVEQIAPSGWNPVPRQQKLKGDLFYLRLVTYPSQDCFEITCNKGGFFVNKSTDAEFDPSPKKNTTFSTLAECISSVCPHFIANFDRLLKFGCDRFQQMKNLSGLSEFDMSTLGTNLFNKNGKQEDNNATWVASPPTRENNTFRGGKALYDPFNIVTEQNGSPRDWNDEYQTILDLPCGTDEEVISRAQLLDKLHNDFVSMATKGAVACIEGSIAPLNPQDPPESHIFVFNSIFYSRAQISPVSYDTVQSASYHGSNHDLQSIIAVNTAIEALRNENPDHQAQQLHTLNTVIVDHLGQRIIAQGIVPGILQTEDTSYMQYGSVNMGKTIEFNEEMHELMKKTLPPVFNLIPESKVENEENTQQVELCGPVSTKGVKGTDGRLYLLDLNRMTPIDLNYYQGNVEKVPKDLDLSGEYIPLLRTELIQQFAFAQQVDYQNEQKAVANKIYHQLKEEGVEDENKIEEKIKEEIAKVEIPSPLLFDPNLFSKFHRDDENKYVENVKILSEFLLSNRIPKFVSEIQENGIPLMDGNELVEKLHNYGINLRYLGQIAEKCYEKSKHITLLQSKDIVVPIPAIPTTIIGLFEIEMIARAIKWFARKMVCYIGESDLQKQFCNILNACFDSNVVEDENVTADNNTNTQQQQQGEEESDKPQEEVDEICIIEDKDFFNKEDFEKNMQDFQLFRKYIKGYIKKHFQYELKYTWNSIERVPLLRRICQLCGVQLFQKEYGFNNTETKMMIFKQDDILNLVPVVKSCKPKYCLNKVSELADQAKQHLYSRDPKDIQTAFQLAQQNLNLICQVTGPNHKNAIDSCMIIASILQKASEYKQAIHHLKRALGLTLYNGPQDSALVGQLYLSIGSLYQTIDKSYLAIKYFKKAIYINDMIAGRNTIEGASLFHKLGSCYANKLPKLALQCIAQAIARAGENKILMAYILRTGATIHALSLNDYSEAFQFEKAAYAMFKQILGKDDPRTLESRKSMEAYTKKIVEIAKSEDKNNKTKTASTHQTETK